MKQFIILLIVSLFIPSCSVKQGKYPNIKTDQIFAELKWGLNYSDVKNILTEKYKLEFSRAIKQGDTATKVFEFNGGMYNDIETKKWTVVFYDDSLIYVQLWISGESSQEKERVYKRLCESNDNEFTKDSTSTPDQNRWYCEREGKRLSNILISNRPEYKEFAVLLSRGS